MKMLLIVNPCSGRIKIKGALFDILQTFCKAGYVVTTQMTTKRGNATEFASKAYAEGYDLVVCCGGDGTLNEVVAGAAGFDNAAVTVFSGGSGNDFSRMFSEPEAFKSLERLLDEMLEEQEGKQAGFETVLKAQANILLTVVFRAMAGRSAEQATMGPEFLENLRQRCSEKLTLQELAELVHLQPNYLCAVFKARTGRTVFEHITRYRCSWAAKLPFCGVR